MRSLNTPPTPSKSNGTANLATSKEPRSSRAKRERTQDPFSHHSTDDLSRRLERLENDLNTQTTIVTRLEAGRRHIEIPVAILGLLFALGSFLGFYKVYQVEQVRGATDGVNKVLQGQIKNQLSTTINKINITKSSEQEKAEILDLKKMVGIVQDLGVKDEEFNGTKALSEILTALIVDENVGKARALIRTTMNNFPRDKFVLSRAKTLLTLIPIAEDRNEISDEQKEELLREALADDNTNAAAANALGIILANQARKKMVIEGDFEEGHKLFKESFLNFEVASLLNPSSTGKLKFINNKIYCSLLEIRYILNTEGANSSYLSVVLQENNAVDLEEFFRNGLIGVGLYEKSAKYPNSSETIAQLLWLQAEYYRKRGLRSDSELKALEDEGAKKFSEALDRDLYARVEEMDQAVKQFKEDYLHHYIVVQRPDLREKILDEIKKKYRQSRDRVHSE